MDDRDRALLLDMALAADDACAFVDGPDEAGFGASRLHQAAVIRCLAVIGEAAGKLSPETRASHPQIPWREITAMRHRLVHGYNDVRLDVVWTVATANLPELRLALRRLVDGAA
jgi:uncharacterized protein with HEPN domain